MDSHMMTTIWLMTVTRCQLVSRVLIVLTVVVSMPSLITLKYLMQRVALRLAQTPARMLGMECVMTQEAQITASLEKIVRIVAQWVLITSPELMMMDGGMMMMTIGPLTMALS
jgi:hypothetical protein